jgi:hypothetical protein
MRAYPITAVGPVLMAAAGGVFFLGCASPPKAPTPEDFVFFGAHPELKHISAASRFWGATLTPT